MGTPFLTIRSKEYSYYCSTIVSDDIRMRSLMVAPRESCRLGSYPFRRFYSGQERCSVVSVGPVRGPIRSRLCDAYDLTMGGTRGGASSL